MKTFKISNDKFYIHNNYIYYIYEDHYNNKCMLKRMKLNGVGNKTIIEDGMQWGVCFTDKYIVFMGDNYIVYRCDLDGSNKKVMFRNCEKEVGERSFRSGSFQIIEDWLYFEDANRDFLLCKMPIEGGEIIDIE